MPDENPVGQEQAAPAPPPVAPPADVAVSDPPAGANDRAYRSFLRDELGKPESMDAHGPLLLPWNDRVSRYGYQAGRLSP